MSSPPLICMAHPNPGPNCETFIQALVDRLPGVCEVLYGGHMPCFDRTGNPLTDTPPVLPPEFSTDGIPVTATQHMYFDALTAHLKDINPDVILAEYGPTGVAMHRVCRDLNIPLIVKFHGYDCSVRETIAKYQTGYDHIFAQAHALVCVSQSQRQALIAMGAPSEKLHVIPTGVDTDRFKEATLEAVQPLFISVGRFVGKKAPEMLINCFAEVVRQIPEARLTMIGEGILHERCVRLAENLGISNAITFAGRVSHTDVRAAMQQARCFVQYSTTPPSGDQEGTPNSVLEASASGLPVIATRHAGIVDAVIHKSTGLLCHEGDVETMTEHMMHMAKQPQEAARFGKAGRQHMQNNYEMSDKLETLAALLKDACSGSKYSTNEDE